MTKGMQESVGEQELSLTLLRARLVVSALGHPCQLGLGPWAVVGLVYRGKVLFGVCQGVNGN